MTIFRTFPGKEVHLQKVWRNGCKVPYLNPWKLKYLSRLVLRILNSNNFEVKSSKAKVFQSCHKSHLGQISQCQLPLKSSCPRAMYLTHLLDHLHLTCEYHPSLQSYCNFSYHATFFGLRVSNHETCAKIEDYLPQTTITDFIVHCPHNRELLWIFLNSF